VSALCVLPLAKEKNAGLVAQAFAVEEVADGGSDIYSRCVHAQHLDPSDCDRCRGYDLAVSEEHVLCTHEIAAAYKSGRPIVAERQPPDFPAIERASRNVVAPIGGANVAALSFTTAGFQPIVETRKLVV
jgi:hypothetical protein